MNIYIYICFFLMIKCTKKNIYINKIKFIYAKKQIFYKLIANYK